MNNQLKNKKKLPVACAQGNKTKVKLEGRIKYKD